MKKSYILFTALAGSIALLSFNWSENSELKTYFKNSHKLFSSGSPAGRTGAPGESNCITCHGLPNDIAQSGIGFNSVIFTDGVGVVSSYTPGQSYTVAVSMATNNPKNGFQITALSSSNTMAGSFSVITGTGTQLQTGTKQYITHTGAGNVQTSWAFTWTAPATNVGDVTFYLATNQTNSNGNDDPGDVIRLSQHVIGSVAGITENNETVSASVGFASSTNTLNIELNSLINGESNINLVDLNGKSVFTEQMGSVSSGENSYQVKLNNELKAGIYVAHISVNNNFVTKKIYID